MMAVFLAGGACAAQYTVEMQHDPLSSLYVFAPQQLRINPGDTVTWVQKDPYSRHNVAAYPDRIPAGTTPFESPLLVNPGEHWSMTFTKEGTYEYHCHPHEKEQMRGTIIVGRPSSPGELRKLQPGDAHQHDHGAAGHHHAPGAKPHKH